MVGPAVYSGHEVHKAKTKIFVNFEGSLERFWDRFQNGISVFLLYCPSFTSPLQLELSDPELYYQNLIATSL